MTGPSTAAGRAESRGGKAFFIVLASIFLMRVGVLLGSQRWLHWDECIIGLLANDVRRGHLHIYFPDQAYGGGAGIASLAIAGLSVPLGASPWALKLYALIVSMATAVVIGLFVGRVWGWTAAAWACALWATAPGLAIFSLQVRAGYIEIQLVATALLLLLHLAAFGPGRWLHFIAAGFLAGLAYYCFSLSLPLILAVAVVAFAWDKLFWIRPRWLAAFGGFILGLGPMIAYDLSPEHRFAHLRWALSMHEPAGRIDLLDRFGRMVAFELPSFFQAQIDDYFVAVPWYAWILGSLTAALSVLWLWQARSDIIRTAGHLRAPSPRPMPWPAGLETVLVLSVAAYLVLYLFGPPTSPRYFVGLYPALAIGMGVAVARGSSAAGAALRTIIVVCGALLTAGGLIVNLHLMNLPGLRTLLGAPTLREGRVAVEPDGIAPVVGWLTEHHIQNVFAHPIIKWKIVFYSNESIDGLSSFSTMRDDDKITPGAAQAAMVGIIREGESYAFVEHKDHLYDGPEGGWVGVAGSVAIMGASREEVRSIWTHQVPSEVQAQWRDRPMEMVPRWSFIEAALREAGMTWQTETMGDYMILHDFRGGSAVETLLLRFRPPRRTPPDTGSDR